MIFSRGIHMTEIRRLQETPKGQYTITMPSQVVRLLGWQKGDEIEIILENRSLRLTKKSD